MLSSYCAGCGTKKLRFSNKQEAMHVDNKKLTRIRAQILSDLPI